MSESVKAVSGDGSQDDAEARRSRWSKLPLWLSLGLATTAVVLYFTVPAFEHWLNHAWEVLTSGDRERISQWVEQFGVWGPLILVGAMIAQMFLLVIPSPLLMAVAIIAYGSWWGTLLAIGAVLAASVVGYLLGYLLGARRMDDFLGGTKVARVRWFVERYGAWTVFVVRLSPFLSNDAISFVGGVLRMNPFKFALATAGGIAPLAIAIAYVGRNSDSITQVFVWVSAVSLAILAGVIWLDRKRRSQGDRPARSD